MKQSLKGSNEVNIKNIKNNKLTKKLRFFSA